MRLLRPVATAIVAVLLVAACGSATPTGSPASPSGSPGSAPTVLPVVASTEFGVGPNRAIFGVVDRATNRPLADPDRTMRVGFTGPDGQTVGPVDATFIWAIENERGVYVANVDFPVAGAWTATFETAAPGAPSERIEFGFDVKEETQVVRPGEPAPSVDTPTADDVGGDLSKLSTDTAPEARFYETSEADALAAKKPFVLVFATPKFCATAQCGPTLERVKAVAAKHPDLTFINVEPYELEVVDGQLQPVLGGPGNGLQAVQSVRQFGLLSEPYVFVVGGDGVVKASFEMIFSAQELEAAIADLG